MDDLFRLTERGADAWIAWMRAAAVAVAIVLGFFLVIDACDALSSSTPAFAARQAARHAIGERLEGEAEAEALLAWAAAESQLPAMARARVWASDRLGEGGVNGFFNPVVYKITLGERFAQGADYDQRWVVFHEAGHVAQMLTGRFSPIALPEWGLSESARSAFSGASESGGSVSGSLLYKQAYSESFADLFALAMAARLDPRDRRAREELALAARPGIHTISISHDTQAALRLGGARLGELAAARGPALLGLIDAMASQGAATTVGEWGAEREALCLEGAWGWSRWARDGAHAYTSNPWRIASMAAPAAGEPRAGEIGELMALTPGRGWKGQRALALAGSSYQEEAQALAGAPRGPGASGFGPSSSQGASEGAGAGSGSWGRALARYERGARNPLRELLAPPLALWAMAVEGPRPRGCAD